MTTLIVPIAGKSISKPIWMHTHPSGRFIAIEAISGLNINQYDLIYFVALKRDNERFEFADGFQNELKKYNLAPKARIILLDQETTSEPHTVFACIQKENISGPIFVKDADSYFTAPITIDNIVCYGNLEDFKEVNAQNKSYIQLDSNGIINNIVEKKIIGSSFSVGGYGFRSAEEFCEYYSRLVKFKGPIYISTIIFEMMLDGHIFIGIPSENYCDWGTIEDWKRYQQTFRTLFVDIDGVLVENSSTHFKPYIGDAAPMSQNIQTLQTLPAERTYIVLVTSRPSEERTKTIEELTKCNIRYDQLIMGLPHCQRIIINDFADSNPYPSCKAINLPRNNKELLKYMEVL